MVNLHVQIPRDLHTALRVEAARRRISVRQLVIEALWAFLGFEPA